MHLTALNQEEQVEGVLMYSEAHQDHEVDVKASANVRIDLQELSKKTNLTANTELVYKLYLKSTQFTMDGTIEQ